MLQPGTQIQKVSCIIVQHAIFWFSWAIQRAEMLFLSTSFPLVCKGSGTLRTEVMQNFIFDMCTSRCVMSQQPIALCIIDLY